MKDPCILVNSVATPVNINDLKKLAAVFKKEIEGIAGINHITIHLILPTNESVCLTSSYNVVDDYVRNEYGQRDHSLIPRYYENLPLYSWDICPLDDSASELNLIKRERYNLRCGTNFVRQLGDSTLIYSVATFINDPIMQYVMISKANQILEAGDYLFNSFHNIYEEYSKISLPKIEIFEPFNGGIDGLIPSYKFSDNQRKQAEKEKIKHDIVHSNQKLKLIKCSKLEEMLNDNKHTRKDSQKLDKKNRNKPPTLYIIK